MYSQSSRVTGCQPERRSTGRHRVSAVGGGEQLRLCWGEGLRGRGGEVLGEAGVWELGGRGTGGPQGSLTHPVLAGAGRVGKKVMSQGRQVYKSEEMAALNRPGGGGCTEALEGWYF